ncbi:hypothetical protein G6F23_013731 [Rhizopus arrhizus]|nr:hypothetical protein G6F23_013731 [Rhizopus arrhizus]KAG0752001.1 hypothetical protein G6F24_013869 [Rhizopus arrhizus]
MRMLASGQLDALTTHACANLQRAFEGRRALQAQLAAIGQRQGRASIPFGLPVAWQYGQPGRQQVGVVAPLLDRMIVPSHARLAVVVGRQQFGQRLLQDRGRQRCRIMAQHPGPQHACGAAG